MLLSRMVDDDQSFLYNSLSVMPRLHNDLGCSFTCFFKFLNLLLCVIYSDEGNVVREKRDLPADSVEADMHCKRPRVSDVDLFSSDVAGQQRLSGDTAGNVVHSSGDVEIVSPSRSAHFLSSTVHSTSAEMGKTAANSLKLNVESYADVDMMDDVEPDGSSSAASSECLQYQPLSGRATVMTEVRSSPAILADTSRKKRDKLIVDETPKPSKCFSVLEEADCHEIADSSMSHSDDVVCINASENNELYHNLVTQSSAADQSFHSLSTVDLDSELVCMLCL